MQFSQIFTDLTGLLPVGAVGDVKEDFEDFYDALRSFHRDGWTCWIQQTLILIFPLDLQTTLQDCCEDGHASFLGEEEDGRKRVQKPGLLSYRGSADSDHKQTHLM